MSHWPWWLGGIALATVGLLHWLTVGRLMSVSSRFTSVVDRVRGVSTRHGGAAAESPSIHAIFAGGVVLGGFLAAISVGGFEVAFVRGSEFVALFGRSPLVGAAVIGLGGVLVGAGTRMARGCTSGHGLCGVARIERGSLASTMAFFGTGVIVSVLMDAVLR